MDMNSLTDTPVGLPADSNAKKDKKKAKLRSAWISFVGRVVAQLVGSAATIVLGLLIADRLRQPPVLHERAPVAAPAASPRDVSPAPRVPGRASIAVLPFQNLSGDEAQDHVADALTETLIAELARSGKGPRVTSRTSVMPYRNTQKSLPAIAAELGVDLIVEGSVLRDGPRVRVIAQLIESATDRHLWARSYDRDGGDLLALHADVGVRISNDVLQVLGRGNAAAPPAAQPTPQRLTLR